MSEQFLSSLTAYMSAALIAQLSFRNRTKKRRRKTYLASKCLYQLKPFDARFEPLVHNEFLASREKNRVESIKADTERQKIEISNKSEKKKSQSPMTNLCWKRHFIEVFIIGIRYGDNEDKYIKNIIVINDDRNYHDDNYDNDGNENNDSNYYKEVNCISYDNDD